MKTSPSPICKRMLSFRYAFQGIGRLFQYEPNVRIHAVAGICVIIAGFLLKISAMEWIAIVIVIGLVISAEAFNTAIEKLCDVVSPDYSESIKHIKDMSAGAVLLTAIASAITGLIIFIPKITVIFL
ncbi:diacylglycerol kinase [Bacteroidia bacterium]|nr:diacylglycerol kinase [Bacteroidia bacterium]